MSQNFKIDVAVKTLRSRYADSGAPIVEFVKAKNLNPFTCVVGTLLSARTQDATTIHVVRKLFNQADTPEKMSRLSLEEIEALVKPVSFYKTKAKHIQELTRLVLGDFNGQVPSNLDDLLKLPGVGRKTANIVLAEAFDIPAISVDTHVHKVTNRWGYVDTANPEKTEEALREKLPKEYWIDFNRIVVAFGQTICVPVSPHCSKCPLSDFCPKVGVVSSR